jgi:hypothetical protein
MSGIMISSLDLEQSGRPGSPAAYGANALLASSVRLPHGVPKDNELLLVCY